MSTAVFQVELRRDRWRAAGKALSTYESERPTALKIAYAALLDVFENGGTFVVVVTDDKVTIVQRDDTENMVEEEPTP